MSGFGDKEDPMLRLYRGYSGTPAHPDSPAGGGGPGNFSEPGPLGRAFSIHLPHPDSPAGHRLTPSDIIKAFEKARTKSEAPLVVTAALLRAVMPKLSIERANAFTGPLNLYFKQYQINNIRRISAFLGQVALESSEFHQLEENLNYTKPERLHAVFPKIFKTVDAAKEYTKNPEKLANHIYANKIGNGDAASGDGWKYRGRGLIQLTGRENYSAFMKATGVDVLNQPDLLMQPEYAVYSAAWFWNLKELNYRADTENYRELTRSVNSAGLHFHERETYRKRAAKVLLRSHALCY